MIKHTLDDECQAFLEKLMYNKKTTKLKGISVLKTITDKEATLFSKYNHINFTTNKKNKEIKEMLDLLEKSYPQTRYSLVKSIDGLK